MVKTDLKNILIQLNDTKWRWSYSIENDKGADSGYVNAIYSNGSLLLGWDEDKLNVKLGDYPPLSLSDRKVVDYKDNQIIITDNKWTIYLHI